MEEKRNLSQNTLWKGMVWMLIQKSLYFIHGNEQAFPAFVWVGFSKKPLFVSWFCSAVGGLHTTTTFVGSTQTIRKDSSFSPARGRLKPKKFGENLGPEAGCPLWKVCSVCKLPWLLRALCNNSTSAYVLSGCGPYFSTQSQVLDNNALASLSAGLSFSLFNDANEEANFFVFLAYGRLGVFCRGLTFQWRECSKELYTDKDTQQCWQQ